MFTWYQLLFFYIYGFPLYILNLSTIFMLIIKHQEFSSSYYQLFLINAINDALLYFFNNIVIRLPLFQPLFDALYSKMSELSFAPTIPMFGVMYCSYFTAFGTFLLTLNRLTAVWKFSTHERIWRKYGGYLIAAAMFGTLVFSFYIFGNTYKYIQVDIGNVTISVLKSSESFSLWNNEVSSSYVVGIFTFLGLIVSVLTFILWQKRKQFIPSKHYDIERSLIFLTLVIYSLHGLSFVYNTFSDMIITDLMGSYLAYFIVSDLISLVPTSAILIASRALRNELFPSCTGGGYQKSTKGKAKLRGPVTVTAVIPTNSWVSNNL